LLSLQTERLTLRPFREEDVPDYAAMCADLEVMRFLGGKAWTRLDAWRHIATVLGHWQMRGFGLWAVEETETETFVGRVGFIQPEGWPGFELGWTLARSCWGKGYATEAARRALTYAFTELEREHVISLIHPKNTASRAVAERLGEQYEDTIEFFGEQISVYGLWRRDWNGDGQLSTQ
jgi:RimJ/RimL family protein N-acetyltransferase